MREAKSSKKYTSKIWKKSIVKSLTFHLLFDTIITYSVASNGQPRLSLKAITFGQSGRFCDFYIFSIILIRF
jgi:hypothetical protein